MGLVLSLPQFTFPVVLRFYKESSFSQNVQTDLNLRHLLSSPAGPGGGVRGGACSSLNGLVG